MSTIIIVWNCRDDYFGTYRSQDGQYQLIVIKETNVNVEREILELIHSLQLKEETFLLFLHQSDNLPDTLRNTFPQGQDHSVTNKCKYFYFGGLEGVLYDYLLKGRTKLQPEIYSNVIDKRLTEKGIVTFHKVWDAYDKETHLQSSGSENPVHHLHRLIDYWENIYKITREEYYKDEARDISKIKIQFEATKQRWNKYQRLENREEDKVHQINKINNDIKKFDRIESEEEIETLFNLARSIFNALEKLNNQSQKILIIDDDFGLSKESRERFLNIHKMYDATQDFEYDGNDLGVIRNMSEIKGEVISNINTVFLSFLHEQGHNYRIFTEEELVKAISLLKKIVKTKEYSIIFLDVRFYLSSLAPNTISADNYQYTLENEHYGFQILSEMIKQGLHEEIALVLMSYDYHIFELSKFNQYQINTQIIERYIRFYDKRLPIAEYVARYTYVSAEEIKNINRVNTISFERIGNTIDTLFKDEKKNQFLNKEEIPYFFLYEIRKQERLNHCLQLRAIKKEVWDELESKTQTERSKLYELAVSIIENYSTAFFIEKEHIHAEKQKGVGEDIGLSQILKMLWEYTPNKRNKEEWEGIYGELIEVFIFLLRNITKEAHISENENKSAAMRFIGGEMFRNTDKQKLIDLFDRMTNIPIRQEDANSSKSSVSQILNFFGISSDNLKKLKEYSEFKEIKDKEDKRGNKKMPKS